MGLASEKEGERKKRKERAIKAIKGRGEERSKVVPQAIKKTVG
jgi:hypothetical protein